MKYEEEGPERRVVTITPAGDRLNIEPLGFEAYQAVYVKGGALPLKIRDVQFTIEGASDSASEKGDLSFSLNG